MFHNLQSTKKEKDGKPSVTCYKLMFLCVLIVFMVLFKYLVLPEFSSILRNVKNIKLLRRNPVAIEQFKEKNKQMRIKIASLRQRIEFLNDRIPVSGQVSYPMTVLDSIVKKHEVLCHEIRYVDTHIEKEFQYLKYQVNLTGNFSGLFRLVFAIENAIIPVQIVSANFELTEQKTNSIQAEIQLSFPFRHIKSESE